MGKIIDQIISQDQVGLKDYALIVDIVPEIAERHTVRLFDSFTPLNGPFSAAEYKDKLYAIVGFYDEASESALNKKEKMIPVTVKVAATDDVNQQVRTLTFFFNRYDSGTNPEFDRSTNISSMMLYLEKAISQKLDDIFINSKDGDTITWEHFIYE